MELETLQDLYINELKDLFSAENQLIKALPKMAKAATNPQLVEGFRSHLEQTKEHATRLERILKSHDETTRGPKCKGMEGLIDEGTEIIEEEVEDDVRDAGLISAAQRVEHYEIAGYGTARTYANLLGDSEGAELLEQTLNEEGATDKKLTQLAETINVAAIAWRDTAFSERNQTMKTNEHTQEKGGAGYILLWLLGIPLPILFVIFLLRGCS